MKKTMSVSHFKEYVLNEAKKLYKIEVLKEEKKRLENLLSENIDSQKNNDIPINTADYTQQPGYIHEKKPSAGLTHKEKSNVVHKAKAGEDIGHKGKGFTHVAAVAAKEYGSKETGEKVAGAAMWKNIKRESVEMSNGSPVEYPMFKFKIKHDHGFIKTKTRAKDLDSAKRIIMNAYECPEVAIQQINETLSPKGVEQVKSQFEQLGARETAVKLVDYFIKKMLGGMTASDLPDSATYANGLDDIESTLQGGDYNAAFDLAKDTAKEMISEEGGGDMFN